MSCSCPEVVLCRTILLCLLVLLLLLNRVVDRVDAAVAVVENCGRIAKESTRDGSVVNAASDRVVRAMNFILNCSGRIFVVCFENNLEKLWIMSTWWTLNSCFSFSTPVTDELHGRSRLLRSSQQGRRRGSMLPEIVQQQGSCRL